MGDRASLKAGIEARYGSPITDEWLDAMLPEAWGHLITVAKCKRSVWVTVDDVPDEIVAVLAAALSRCAANPNSYRNEQIGDYQYTYAGNVQQFFTNAEEGIIGVFSECGRGGAYTVNVGTPYTTPPLDNEDNPPGWPLP